MSKPLQGVGYDLNATNRGFSLDIHAPDYVEPGDGFGIMLPLPPVPDLPYLPIPQFQCFATPGATGSAYEGQTILKICAGGVTYTNSNMPYIAEGVEQNFAQAFITKAAVLSTGVVAVPGAVPITSLTPLMLNNGFYALANPANKYYVVLSYYDADGDPSALDVPILTQRTPWVSILEEGCTEFSKIFIEQGPSYYTGLLNVAPMTEYDDAGSPKKFFGFNHTGYFNPTKFGANVKVIAVIENNVVTQCAQGSQNLTIPLHNHGTRLMYTPGMTEADDPYYANEGSDWSYVVNTADITALSSVSYTGGWWSQITDNAHPIAVTTHNYSYYSVNYEGTDNMPDFTCAVIGWPTGETISHRLRIKSGLVSFHKPVVDEDTGYLNSTDGNDPTDLIEYNLRINKPNIYQTDKLHIGLNDNPDYMHNDGYVELEEGSDYYVFLFKLTPDWSTYNEAKAPQLVIAKLGDTPNTAITTQINGGSVIKFTNVITNDGPYQQLLTSKAFYMAVDCVRKDIAYVKWDSTNSIFKVYQINSGAICLDDKPITSQNLSSNIPTSTQRDWKHNNDPVSDDPFVLVDGMYNTTYTGYTKSLNTESDIQTAGSTTADKYIPKQPSQIESPDIT